jgi:hypothetical protein
MLQVSQGRVSSTFINKTKQRKIWAGNVTYKLDMRSDYNNTVVVRLWLGGDANLKFYGVALLNVAVLFREDTYLG